MYYCLIIIFNVSYIKLARPIPTHSSLVLDLVGRLRMTNSSTLTLGDLKPGTEVEHHFGIHVDPLVIVGGVTDYTFYVGAMSVTVKALEVRAADGRSHFRSLYFLGLEPDKGEMSGNYLTRPR